MGCIYTSHSETNKITIRVITQVVFSNKCFDIWKEGHVSWKDAFKFGKAHFLFAYVYYITIIQVLKITLLNAFSHSERRLTDAKVLNIIWYQMQTMFSLTLESSHKNTCFDAFTTVTHTPVYDWRFNPA